MISVLILTRNEEANLPKCLESIKWCNDIVVFDSFSTDRTVEIAQEAGVRVFQREFDNECDHRAASLKLPFANSWVYNPDADEVTPPELRDEILRVVGDKESDLVAYRVRFKTMFMGKWIRYSSLYPTWVVRLFRPEYVSFSRRINLTYHIEGPEGRLKNHYYHYTFNKGIAAWFNKHNKYSTGEAIESLKLLEADDCSLFKHLREVFLARTSVDRRRALKAFSFMLPGRPILRFFYMFLFRFGILDGLAGFHYCRLLTIYEYMIVLKIKERKRRNLGLSI